MLGSTTMNSFVRSLLPFAAMSLSCFGAAWLTELIATHSGGAISIWLTTGFVMAAAVASPRSRWSLWALAAAAAEASGNMLWYGQASYVGNRSRCSHILGYRNIADATRQRDAVQRRACMVL
ncbi:MAG: hypothetical protein HC788_03395 [Sphingopyxis sp.]|nr:hypothetical protein [Sphingopyxis sp.]